MEKRIEELAEILKKGNKIHIKKKNRGKFTASAKAAGRSVQEHARAVLNDPNATPLQKKRANFARNAAKWHRKYDEGGELTFEGITTTNNRPYNAVYIKYIDSKLRNAGMSANKRASILANIIEESGGNPFAEGPGGFYGLLQGGGDRYQRTTETNVYKELDNQINYILQTVGNSTDRKSGTHGGKGSGYNSYTDAMKAFESDKIADSLKGFTLGYVRPAGMLNSYNNRLRVAQQLLGLTGFYQKGSKLIYTPFAKDEEQEEENRSGLVYKPMINNMQDDMFNFIYEGFKPSFPVEPVQVPTAAKPTATEETPAQQTTSIQDIDISGPTTSEIIEEETPQKEEIVVPETVATNPAPVEQPQRRPILIRPTIPSAQAPADNTRVTPTAVTPAQQAKKMGTIKYAKANMNVGNMGEFIEMARKNGVSFMVTSGYRPGAMAANGRPSHHGAGNAIDIVPIPGQTFEDILEQMRNAPELLAGMRAHKIGVLDERSRAMLAKTKGTGAHFHIGPDNSAIADFKKFFG